MAKPVLNESLLVKALNWAYAKSLSGVGGTNSATELAKHYLKGEGSLDSKIDTLIKWQVTKAGTSGFVTGFGGLATMPFILPANIVSVIYLQVRMIMAIAYMRGYDLNDDRVKTLVFICMVGNSAKKLLKEAGIKAGEKLLTHFLTDISTKTILYVNQKVGYKLLVKFTEKGLSNLGKIVPVVGGLIGAGIDAASTKVVGKVAKKVFVAQQV